MTYGDLDGPDPAWSVVCMGERVESNEIGWSCMSYAGRDKGDIELVEEWILVAIKKWESFYLFEELKILEIRSGIFKLLKTLYW